MSVIISNYNTISRNPLNQSKAKFLWSFGKDKRFRDSNSVEAKYLFIITSSYIPF